MFDLKSASIEIRKAAAIQGIRSGKIEFFSHPDNCNNDSDVVAYVENKRKQVKISYNDIQIASCYTWKELG